MDSIAGRIKREVARNIESPHRPDNVQVSQGNIFDGIMFNIVMRRGTNNHDCTFCRAHINNVLKLCLLAGKVLPRLKFPTGASFIPLQSERNQASRQGFHW